MEARQEKIKEVVRTFAAEFLAREANRLSLITVTDVRLSRDGKLATVLFTVLPQEKEKGALDFAKRKRSEFREYIMEHSRLQRPPFFDFAIDEGEKNRQRLDEIMA